MKNRQRYLEKAIRWITAICFMIAAVSCSGSIDKIKTQEENKALKKTSESIVFKNVNIIPMTKEVILEGYSVLVWDGKIKAIDKFENLKLSETTKIVDATGKYLMPGLSDMHVHIDHGNDGTLLLANGVTLVRNMWGNPRTLALKRDIQKKLVRGPEIYTTGALIDGPGAYWTSSLIIENPEDVPEVVHKMKADGYDAIKVYNKLSREVYNEIISVAKSINMPVVGHVPFAVGIKKVMESGQSSTEHFIGYGAYSPIPYDKNELAELTVQSGIWNCPTLLVMRNYKNLNEVKNKKVAALKYVSPMWKGFWSRSSPVYYDIEYNEELLKVMYDKGARIAAGTDAGNPYVIHGFSLHEELQYMNEAGLTPWQVLLTATINAAEMVGYEDRLGTVEAGKEADLLLLNKNPLEDIKNTSEIFGVVSKGSWFPQTELQTMLDKIAQSYSKENG